tara:strand:+ start:261 stop:542 length:282 start_codon:yes stop_codon:yes gene_type:complete
MVKKNIKTIRKKLDILDNKLLNLFKKRTSLVNDILKTKEFKNQIVDKKRIKIILKKVRAKSIKMKIDPEITINIWKSIIRSYIKYEYKKFKKK